MKKFFIVLIIILIVLLALISLYYFYPRKITKGSEIKGNFGFAGIYTDDSSLKTKNLNADSVRFEVWWEGFSNFDKNYDRIKKNQLEPIVNLRTKHSYKTQCDKSLGEVKDNASCPPKDLVSDYDQYGYSKSYYKFVTSLLNHAYTTNRPIHYIIVENEVNTKGFWAGSSSDYLKERATVYKATQDFNEKNGTTIKIVDNGAADLAWSNAIIREKYCNNDTAQALSLAKNFMRRNVEKEITLADLSSLINCQDPSREYQIVNDLFKPEAAFNGPSFDYMDYHFYLPYDTEKIVIDWIKNKMQQNGYQKPIWVGEGGFYDKVGTDENISEDLVKKHVIAFANGVEKWIWYPLTETKDTNVSSTVYKGLYSNNNQELPQANVYKIMTSKLDNFQSAQEESVEEGVTLYKFMVQDKEVFVAWANEQTGVDLSKFMDENMRITKINGVSGNIKSSEVILSQSPIFLEKTN